MDAEITLPVRVRLSGVVSLDEAKSYARHIVEAGGQSEGEVGLPTGVRLLEVECGAIIGAVEMTNRKGKK